MNFFIKKNSTLPELIFPITEELMNKYSILSTDFDNVAVTFSMIDQDSNIFRIANAPADLIIETPNDRYPEDRIYFLVYKFNLKQTKVIGNYSGEFKIDFIGENGCVNNKITIPTNGDAINIIISDSITKTTII